MLFVVLKVEAALEVSLTLQQCAAIFLPLRRCLNKNSIALCIQCHDHGEIEREETGPATGATIEVTKHNDVDGSELTHRKTVLLMKMTRSF